MATATAYRGSGHTGVYTVTRPESAFYFSAGCIRTTDVIGKADQPFVSPDGRYALLFNGEIYNSHDFKNLLIGRGYRFVSSSDTETLFYSLIEFGEKVIEKLEGMFAFLFFDQEKTEALIARDRFGMKPLFYFEDEHYLIISSGIKGILASGLVKKELNESQIACYLRNRYAEKPNTFFKNIYEFSEGCKGLIAGNVPLQRRKFTVKNKIETISDKDLPAMIEEATYEALLKQLSPSAPTGLFLSGGVDSTLLLSMAQMEGISMPTFSIVYEKEAGSFKTDDRKFSRMAVRKFGSSINHHEIEINAAILNDLDEMIDDLDQPVADSGALLTWQLGRYAAALHIRAALSGAGADELFAGYNRHAAYRHYLRHYRLYKNAYPFLQTASRFLPTGFDHPWRKEFRLLKKFLNSLDNHPFQTFLNFTALSFPGSRQTQFPLPTPLEFSIEEFLSKALEYDRRNYLISDVLAISNRMCAVHSLEMRTPYLDSNLANLAIQANPDFLLSKGKKWILKEMLSKRGGTEFTRRPKEGFGAPFGYWLKTSRLEYLESEFTSMAGNISAFVDGGHVKRMYYDHVKGRVDYSSELWACLVLARWLSREFG